MTVTASGAGAEIVGPADEIGLVSDSAARVRSAPPPGVPARGAPACEHRIVIFDVLVEVSLRSGIADPQGSTIERSLPKLGVGNITGVRVGKAMRFAIDADSADSARAQVDDLCQRFLTNPVIEDAAITIVERAGAPAASGAEAAS